MKVLRIVNWDTHFENNRTRKLISLNWVPIPNKMDGDGFTQLMDHSDGIAHFGAWVLIVEIASKCSPRGTLLRGISSPYDAQSLSRVTRANASLLNAAISRLIEIGWLEEIEHVCTIPALDCADGAPKCAIPAPYFPDTEISRQITDTHRDRHNSATECAIPAPKCAEYDLEGNGRERNNSLACEATIVGAAKEPARLELAIEIYECYPKKAEKQDAIKAILKAMKSHASDFLRKQTITYAEVVKGCDPQYVPYPAKWFRKERFNDDPSTWKINPPKIKPRRAMGHI